MNTTPETETRRNILFLCNYDPYNAATVCDHINAFCRYSRHEIHVFNHLVPNGGDLPDDLALDEFDGVVVHYSIFLAIDAYISHRSKRRLADYQGLKAVFIQDEHRFVDTTLERLRWLGIDVLFTCVPEPEIEKVYPQERLPNLRKVNVLTGYVAENLFLYTPRELRKRRYDVSYRGRKYPAWHGRLGLEKWKIAEEFKKRTRWSLLRTNISYKESDRVYGAEWVSLLQNSKAVLGAESGASVFDHDGSVSGRVESITHLLGDKRVSYADLKAKYFGHLEAIIRIEQMSPRIFEAVALRTLCILFEGEYSGVIQPWRHYVPLKKDFSNLPEVIAFLRNEKKVADMITNAYVEVALNPRYSYRSFVAMVDDVLDAEFLSRKKGRRPGDPVVDKKRFREKWPFFLVSNPHGLSRGGFSARHVLLRCWNLLPGAIRNRLRPRIRW